MSAAQPSSAPEAGAATAKPAPGADQAPPDQASGLEEAAEDADDAEEDGEDGDDAEGGDGDAAGSNSLTSKQKK